MFDSEQKLQSHQQTCVKSEKYFGFWILLKIKTLEWRFKLRKKEPERNKPTETKFKFSKQLTFYINFDST